MRQYYYKMRCMYCGRTGEGTATGRNSDRAAAFRVVVGRGVEWRMWVLLGRIAVCDECVITVERKVTHGVALMHLPPGRKAAALRAIAKKLRLRHKAKPGQYYRSIRRVA